MLRVGIAPVSQQLARISVSVRGAPYRAQRRGFSHSWVVRSNLRVFSSTVLSSQLLSERGGCSWTHLQQVRCVRPRSKPGPVEEEPKSREETSSAEGSGKPGQTAENPNAEKANHSEHSDTSGNANDSSKAGEKPKEERQGFFRQLLGIKDDVTTFPEIYNAPNIMNMILFTIFCLASTGSSVEADWWVNQWGVDAAFRPWAWILHSWMTNNFLSMSFAMMLVHSMAHSVVGTIGNRGLVAYCAITSVVAGFLMWALNASLGNRSEKQFGPWDILSALFVMQYLHQGITPWAILSGFTGWVRYACYVGAVCILYYDWQPVLFGSALGFLLCRTRYRVAPVAGKP